MFKQRLITALILAPLMVGGIFFLPIEQFAYFIGFIVTVAAWEWANLSGYSSPVVRIAYAGLVAASTFAVAYLISSNPEVNAVILAVGAFWWLIACFLIIQYPKKVALWQAKPVRAVLGFFVLIPMWVGFMTLKSQEHSSLIIVYVMLLIWGADTGAYFAGKTWGKAKLAPNVSPGKSWAGFWGGLATTGLISIVFSLSVHLYLRPMSMADFALLAVITFITAIISVMGDLLESMMKRHRGIKDSSQLLPGHGGVLDRIDSMASAVPVFAFCMLLFGWQLAA
ncbi:MAG: phosphatidate cytidylyltransferase [Oleispira sp.]|nr:phosphatidate cytidylyltransferase [Oleispira sp.]